MVFKFTDHIKEIGLRRKVQNQKWIKQEYLNQGWAPEGCQIPGYIIPSESTNILYNKGYLVIYDKYTREVLFTGGHFDSCPVFKEDRVLDPTDNKKPLIYKDQYEAEWYPNFKTK